MDKYISVPLQVEGIAEFFRNCQNVLYPITHIKDGKCDCTKIEVSMARFDIIKSYYVQMGQMPEATAVLWVMYGPKVNESLIGDVVHIQDGFIREV